MKSADIMAKANEEGVIWLEENINYLNEI